MPRSVAFFRNLNLGQGWAPTRPQLVAAYEAAGATDVDNVQSNGTILFTAAAHVSTTRAVLATLKDLTGYADIAVVRTANWVWCVAEESDELDLPDDEAHEVVFFDAKVPVEIPWTSPDGHLRILGGGAGYAITSFKRYPRGPGSTAGPTLEQLTGVKGTARGVSTIRRLAARIRNAPS
ncbi:DUF1697 domain-containing protein [Nocardioides bigeumensis]|uniref:DUF1697 domain-containing protein n=1 Tax=Nocardioides bigeumensis TaxID=433657 RepID=A0ABN2Y714_9ACTN